MTHHTDAERAAYERELIDNHHYVPSDFSFKDGFYGGDDDYIQFGWDLWQAARRAPAAPVQKGDYLDGVNIPRLREALTFLGRCNGVGEGEVANKLSEHVNSITRAVLTCKELLRQGAPAAPVPKGWKLVPDEANMTDEQAEAICRLANVCGGGAYGIYRAALEAAPQPADAWPVAADPAQQPSADDFLKELAALRDLFPVPKIGSSHETRWMAAISNPSEVLTYVINMVRELLAGKALAAALLRATQRHLPPENIGAHETIAEIISIVDPWPLAKPPANET